MSSFLCDLSFRLISIPLIIQPRPSALFIVSDMDRFMLVVRRAFSLSSAVRCFGNAMLTATSCSEFSLFARLMTWETNHR